jgi:Carboxypeptidase regulatory-like domain/PDZ domain
MKRRLAVAALVVLGVAALLAIPRRRPTPTVATATAERQEATAAAEPAAREPALAVGEREETEAPNVAGVVLGEDGQPVEDAEVMAFSDWSPRGPTRTDERGRFALSLEPGKYSLLARKGPSVGQYEHEVLVAPDAVPETEVVIRLERGLTISGRVTGDRGAPVADAEVEAGVETGDVFPMRAASCSSDGDGAFHIDGLLPGRYQLSVDAEGFARGERSLRLDRDRGGVDFALVAGAVVDGRVTTERGDPVIKAWVRARRPDDDDLLHSLAGDITDDEGRFHIDKLRAGKLLVEVTTAAQGSAEARLELTAGARRELELKLAEGRTITGIVVDEHDHPVEGVAVSEGPEHSVNTGGDGRFKLVGLDRGFYFVHAVAPDGRKTGKTGELDRTAELKLVLPAGGHRLRGVVLAPDGSPAWGAQVTAIGVGHRAFGHALTGDDGRFAVGDLSAGRYTLYAEKEGFPKAVSGEVDADADNVVLQLPAAASLAGVAVDGRGRALRDYSITVESSGQADWRNFQRPQTRSIHDAGGAFRVGGLSAGTYTLLARAVDGRVGQIDDVALTAGQERRGLRIVVGAGVSVDGRVIDHQTGAAVRGATVSAGKVSTSSDENGQFSLPELPRGAVEIWLHADGYASESRTLHLDGDLSLGNVHLLRGKLPASPVAYDGIEAEQRDGRAVVAELGPGSPAEAAGIRVGDAILSINGVDAASLGNEAINILLAGPVGATIQLTVATGGAPRTVTLQLAAITR